MGGAILDLVAVASEPPSSQDNENRIDVGFLPQHSMSFDRPKIWMGLLHQQEVLQLLDLGLVQSLELLFDLLVFVGPEGTPPRLDQRYQRRKPRLLQQRRELR